MRITLFGATGKTGRHVLRHALEQGHYVRAYARNPQNIQTTSDRLDIVTGEYTNTAAIASAIEGADVVISTLGPGKASPPDLMSFSAQSIVKAMSDNEVPRLIWMTGAGVKLPGDQFSLSRPIVRGLMKLVAASVLRDSEGAARIIQDSPVQWTIARAPILADAPSSGNIVISTAPPKPKGVSREDIALFLLSEAEQNNWINAAPFIGVSG